MMQAAARRFRQWFHRSEQAPQAQSAPDDEWPAPAVPAPAPMPAGLEDTAPVDIEGLLPTTPAPRPVPPPLPPRRSTADAGDGAVATPVKEVSDWSAVIAAAKRRCEPSGRA